MRTIERYEFIATFLIFVKKNWFFGYLKARFVLKTWLIRALQKLKCFKIV